MEPVKTAEGLVKAAPDSVFASRPDSAAGPLNTRRSRWVFAVNGLAAVAIAAAIAFRLAQAGMPPDVIREEGAVLGVGVIYAGVVIWFRFSPIAYRTGIQILLMAANVLLSVIALGVAGAVLVTALVIFAGRPQ